MQYNKQISSDYFVLCAYTDSDFEPYNDPHPYSGGGYIRSFEEEVFWDNLNFFKVFCKEAQKDVKTELKESGIWQKGMLKDLKDLINEAKEKGLL